MVDCKMLLQKASLEKFSVLITAQNTWMIFWWLNDFYMLNAFMLFIPRRFLMCWISYYRLNVFTCWMFFAGWILSAFHVLNEFNINSAWIQQWGLVMSSFLGWMLFAGWFLKHLNKHKQRQTSDRIFVLYKCNTIALISCAETINRYLMNR